MVLEKLVFDVESEYKGYVYLLRKEGAEIGTLEPLALVAESLAELNDQKESYLADIKKDGNPKNQNATRKAIIRAKEAGVNLSDLNIDGVIKEKDVDEFLKANISMPDDAREVIFPQGVEVLKGGSEEPKSSVVPPSVPNKESNIRPVSSETLESDYKDVIKQASDSREPDEGESII